MQSRERVAVFNWELPNKCSKIEKLSSTQRTDLRWAYGMAFLSFGFSKLIFVFCFLSTNFYCLFSFINCGVRFFPRNFSLIVGLYPFISLTT